MYAPVQGFRLPDLIGLNLLSDPNIPAVDHLNNINPYLTLVVSRQVNGTFLYTYPKCGMDLVLRLLLARPIYCWSIY